MNLWNGQSQIGIFSFTYLLYENYTDWQGRSILKYDTAGKAPIYKKLLKLFMLGNGFMNATCGEYVVCMQVRTRPSRITP